MKEYFIQKNLEELTPEQINDSDLLICLKTIDDSPISIEKDYKCQFYAENLNVEVYKENYIKSYNSTITLYDRSKCDAYNKSHVITFADNIVKLFDASSGYIRGKSIVYAYHNSNVNAMDESTVFAFNISTVIAHNSSTIYANDYSRVKSNGIYVTIIAYDDSFVQTYNHKSINMHHNTIVCDYTTIGHTSIKLHGNSIMQTYKIAFADLAQWIKYNNATLIGQDYILLYKKVSNDYKTQENTTNETSWLPGTTVEMPMYQWNPAHRECGAGKFHACAYPIACNHYRDEKNDKYVAISVNINDIYVWTPPSYPKKIAFRKGTVLHECDITGNKIRYSN